MFSIFTTPALAEMYKWVDEEGNISYSDEPPSDNTEKLTPPELTVTPAIKVPAKKPAETAPKMPAPFFGYKEFSITSPANDQTIRNNQGNIDVSFSSKPTLNTELGHYISVEMDGKTVRNKLKSSSVRLENTDRGSHTIKARLKDKNGLTLMSSQSVTIHLHRISILHKKPR